MDEKWKIEAQNNDITISIQINDLHMQLQLKYTRFTLFTEFLHNIYHIIYYMPFFHEFLSTKEKVVIYVFKEKYYLLTYNKI